MSNLRLFIPEHGGNIEAAAEHFGIVKSEWLDLSSAVNPWHYPVPTLPPECFTELPYWQNDFLQAATTFYGQSNFVVGAGTQAFIESLPAVLKTGSILVPEHGYQEHKKAWQKNSNAINTYPSFDLPKTQQYLQQALARNNRQHLLVINPNNPTAMVLSVDYLQKLAAQLAEGYYLIVDEAFIDNQPAQSLLNQALPKNIIVLRSFGKFFGLPGLRLGFAFANSVILKALKQKMPLWQITGASQYIASKALADSLWHEQTRQLITSKQAQQQPLLIDACQKFNGNWRHFDLFSSLRLSNENGLRLYQGLAQQGILLRFWQLNTGQVLLRFALCANEPQLNRLIQAIEQL